MSKLEKLTINSSRDHTSANDQKIKVEICSLMNERITEDIVREILKENKKSYSKITIYEQKVDNNPRIEKLLKNASKQGGGLASLNLLSHFMKSQIYL